MLEAQSLKYNIPLPRYTSYPTYPQWNNALKAADVAHAMQEADATQLSLYVHLPFCESLCTYCGCNTRITTNHRVEPVYISHLLQEAGMYAPMLPAGAVFNALHFGGGTPTFFSAAHLAQLVESLAAVFPLVAGVYSIEAHPAHTTARHLMALRSVGFNRLSIGVQDFSPRVLHAIHRLQTADQVMRLSYEAQELGFHLNFDMVYGLPFQTMREIENSLAYIAQLRPGRIAWYAYAHVPWKKPGQRGYSESDLPTPASRSMMYDQIQKGLTSLGYHPIGFDHYALPNDELYVAYQTKRLHRNFMGYVEQKNDALLGLGASAISEWPNAYWQNEKLNERYYVLLGQGTLPKVYSHQTKAFEQQMRSRINELLCYLEVEVPANFTLKLSENKQELLHEMQLDGLVVLSENRLKVTEQGRKHLRLAAALLDNTFEPQWAESRYSSGV